MILDVVVEQFMSAPQTGWFSLAHPLQVAVPIVVVEFGHTVFQVLKSITQKWFNVAHQRKKEAVFDATKAHTVVPLYPSSRAQRHLLLPVDLEQPLIMSRVSVQTQMPLPVLVVPMVDGVHSEFRTAQLKYTFQNSSVTKVLLESYFKMS